MFPILVSIVNMIGEITLNPHFDNEKDASMSSKNNEANGNGRDLNALVILH